MRRILGWCVDAALDISCGITALIQGAIYAGIMLAPVILMVLYRCGYLGG